MRQRPFALASEQARPFSEIVAERRLSDPLLRARERAWDDVAALEAEAAGARNEDERRRLQCEAEALRCALAETAR